MIEVDRVDAGRLQGVALQVQRLEAVGLRDAGVADQHVSQTVVCDTRAWPPARRARPGTGAVAAVVAAIAGALPWSWRSVTSSSRRPPSQASRAEPHPAYA